ncbi:MAG: AMP-binding protein, partial [Gammaproteobacteria bacterium]|nr:AMP-binding protein [Gammaproteobacteria bacterium]
MTKTKHADDSQPLWRLSPHAMRGTAMHRFMQQTSARHGFAPEYDALYRWSIDDRAAFWSALWEFTAVRASRRWECALENADAMPGAQWFTGARLNFAENLLRYRDDQTAILFSGEDETNIRAITYRQLYAEVARVTAGLRSLGVQPGDRVACYLPNCPEAIVAMLAAAALGAVWSSCSPDFGVKGVLERFAQIQPRVLFAADGYRYNGKAFDKRDAVTSVAAGLDNLECVVTVRFLNDAPDWSALRNQHRVIS